MDELRERAAPYLWGEDERDRPMGPAGAAPDWPALEARL